jgi:hypothetical protein
MLGILLNAPGRVLRQVKGFSVSAWHQRQAIRTVWGEDLDQREAIKAESFYDSTVEKVIRIILNCLSSHYHPSSSIAMTTVITKVAAAAPVAAAAAIDPGRGNHTLIMES